MVCDTLFMVYDDLNLHMSITGRVTRTQQKIRIHYSVARQLSDRIDRRKATIEQNYSLIKHKLMMKPYKTKKN